MSRVLEAIFRHPLQLFLMLTFPIVVGLAIAYVLPRSYQSSASLWALRRYEIIGATGPESDLQSTPATTQVAALSELLQSRDFSLAVAKSTDLASTLKLTSSNPQLVDDALSQEITKNVVVTVRGNNLYEVTYMNKNPHVAYQVVAAVIKEFQSQGQGISVVEGERLLQGYQSQLTQAKDAADNDAKTEAQYLIDHPDLTKAGANPLNDPEYALLDAKRLQSQSTLQNLQTTIATINEEIATQGTGTDSFFKTLDTPLQPDVAVSRTKTFLMAGGVGAAIAILACVVYVLLLVRRDRGLYTSLELQKLTGHRVLMQLPQLSLTTMQVIMPDDQS
ncbi:MAG: hypothetical protein JO011_21360 [Ktedonobacteraceae bacterium]|nr:hypothetical protein [Ktedonobacteraceae bacterium]